ncbi:MAG: hypothetical protein LBD01_03540 [Puniceicoccales bacterium]|jgi:hypothetical protein|nr:hypothetical protein [Puniceicoccales bacterium]
MPDASGLEGRWRMTEHPEIQGVDPKLVEVRTDLGSEFDGDTVHFRLEGFRGAIVAMGARHHFNPPARPNCNADVESVHATIENEFFDLENFSGCAHFMAAAGTYQHFYNFARKNRSRANKTSVELLREKAPNLHPRILLLRPCLLDSHMGQLLSGLPSGAVHGELFVGKNLYGAEIPAGGYESEGFAEFLKLFLLDPGKAQAIASATFKVAVFGFFCRFSDSSGSGRPGALGYAKSTRHSKIGKPMRRPSRGRQR